MNDQLKQMENALLRLPDLQLRNNYESEEGFHIIFTAPEDTLKKLFDILRGTDFYIKVYHPGGTNLLSYTLWSTTHELPGMLQRLQASLPKTPTKLTFETPPWPASDKWPLLHDLGAAGAWVRLVNQGYFIEVLADHDKLEAVRKVVNDYGLIPIPEGK